MTQILLCIYWKYISDKTWDS